MTSSRDSVPVSSHNRLGAPMGPRLSPLSRWFSLCAFLIVVSASLARASAQCATQWLPGSGLVGTDGRVFATTMWDADGAGPGQPLLVVGGAFSIAGSAWAYNIATYDPGSGVWSPLGTGMDYPVLSLTTLPNGDLVAGGYFTTAGGVSANSIARWNGTSWSPLGSGMDSTVLSLTALPNGHLVAGGYFTTAGGVSADKIARWNGTNWAQLGSGMDGAVNALATLPNGDLVAGGIFTTAGGVSADKIARWDGTSWSPLGSGTDDNVEALTMLSNGDVVAGGWFGTAGGVGVNHIARWNGTSWSQLGTGMNQSVLSLTTLPNGDLVAGGQFDTAGSVTAHNIARWNGTNWSPLGSGMNGVVFALATLPNGDLVAGGIFTTAGGVSADNIARWNGTSWLPLGLGTDSTVIALTTLPNGDLVAGGVFGFAGGVSAIGIARWNGTSWSALGSTGLNGAVAALTTLPNRDLVAGGGFTYVGGVSASRIARWNGTSWSALGLGMSGSGMYNAVYALTTLPNGDLVAGGGFSTAGGAVSACVAQLTTTCPATTAPFGAGCIGTAGPNVLTATSLPWTGSTFTAVATGMPAISLALSVLGFSTASVPLSSILPQGVPGCTLWVSPDILTLYVPSVGIVTMQIVIPNAVALAGQIQHQQVVPIELDAVGNIVALTSTNALTLTIGAF